MYYSSEVSGNETWVTILYYIMYLLCNTYFVSVLMQVQQWAEIQAHSRKMPLEEFLALAEKKKQELQVTLQVQ